MKSDWHGVTMRYETVINCCFVSISMYNLSNSSEKLSMLNEQCPVRAQWIGHQRNMRNFWWFKAAATAVAVAAEKSFYLQKSTFFSLFFCFNPKQHPIKLSSHFQMKNSIDSANIRESVTIFRITMLQFPLVLPHTHIMYTFASISAGLALQTKTMWRHRLRIGCTYVCERAN